MHRFLVTITMTFVLILAAAAVSAQSQMVKKPKLPAVTQKLAVDAEKLARAKAGLETITIEQGTAFRLASGQIIARAAFTNKTDFTIDGMGYSLQLHNVTNDTWSMPRKNFPEMKPGQMVWDQTAISSNDYDKARAVAYTNRGAEEVVIVAQYDYDLSDVGPFVTSLTVQTCSGGQRYVVAYQNDEGQLDGLSIQLMGRDFENEQWTELVAIQNMNIANGAGNTALTCQSAPQKEFVRVLLNGYTKNMKDELFQMVGINYLLMQ